MYISEFSRKIGVSINVLRRWHEEGVLVPDRFYPRGDRYYSEEQVKKYLAGEYEIPELKYLTSTKFAEEIGVSISTLTRWDLCGRLKPVYISEKGVRYYSKEQVKKYYDGVYDCKEEDGFISRDSFAQLIGVSIHTLISWSKKDILKPHHKSVTRAWLYTAEQVEEAKNIKEKSRKRTLQKP